MFSARVADGQVTPVQFGLLSILIRRPGIDQATLGAELGLDPANVAEILRRLEDRLLLTRVVDPLNRRRKLCLATPDGKPAVAVRSHAIEPSARQSASTCPTALSPTEQQRRAQHDGEHADCPGIVLTRGERVRQHGCFTGFASARQVVQTE